MDSPHRAVLLGRRRNIFGDGEWALPGGHLQFGESFEEAAARELAEETNLTASDLRTFMPLNTPYEETHYVQIGVEALRFSGILENREPHKCSDLRFFSLDDLPEPLFGPSIPFLLDAQSRNRLSDSAESLILYLQAVDETAGRAAFASLYLVGSGPTKVILASGHIGARPRTRFVPSNFEDQATALEFVRSELRRRFTDGYDLIDMQGTLSLAQVRALLPDDRGWQVGVKEQSVPYQQSLGFDQMQLPLGGIDQLEDPPGSKARRLAELAAAVPSGVPPTVRTVRELDEYSGVPLWFVRTADSGVASLRRPMSRSEARDLLRRAGHVELQPYIAPSFSGAICLTSEATLTEAIEGPADLLFRGGRSGMLLFDCSEGRWSNGERPGDGSWTGVLPALLEQSRPLIPALGLAVVEWILDNEGRLWLVDLKHLPTTELAWHLDGTRPSFVVRPIGRAPADEAPTALGDTALEGAAGISSGSVVTFESGGVLSHVVLRLARIGCTSSVGVSSGSWL
jgi:8-oxo-dGTP diphosphatase